MDHQLKMLQIKIGLALGKKSSCGKKFKYKTFESASYEAEKLSLKFGPKHAYYCIWCGGYHVGRRMTSDESLSYLM